MCLQKPDAQYNVQLAKRLHGLEHHKVIWVKPSDTKASHLLLTWAAHHAAPANVAAANTAGTALCGKLTCRWWQSAAPVRAAAANAHRHYISQCWSVLRGGLVSPSPAAQGLVFQQMASYCCFTGFSVPAHCRCWWGGAPGPRLPPASSCLSAAPPPCRICSATSRCGG